MIVSLDESYAVMGPITSELVRNVCFNLKELPVMEGIVIYLIEGYGYVGLKSRN